MGKAFTRLTSQVQGRTPGRTRYVPLPARLAELEKAILETLHYLCTEVANDPASPSDSALTAAYHEFKKHLEGTIV